MQSTGSLLKYALVAYGYGRWVARPAGPRGGRPTRVFMSEDGAVVSGMRVDGTSAHVDETASGAS